MDTEDRLYLRERLAGPISAFIGSVVRTQSEDITSNKIAGIIADIALLGAEAEGFKILKPKEDGETKK
jgi:hypothetical protein